MNKPDGRSPWFYLGAGCGCLALLVLLVVAALVWSGARMARNIKAQIDDPQLRGARAMQLLGTDRLPEGYEPDLSLQIPLLGTVVLLQDRHDSERTFIYLESRLLNQEGLRHADLLGDPSKLNRFIEGQGIRLNDAQSIGHGAFELGRQKIFYGNFSGRIERRGRQSEPRLTTLALIECPTASALGRIGLWIRELPAESQAPIGEPEEAELRSFLSAFDFCRD